MMLIINANREGYDTTQVSETMTVGQLAEMFAYYAREYGEDTQVFLGHDKQRDGLWYTYGGITEGDIEEHYEDEFEEEEDE